MIGDRATIEYTAILHVVEGVVGECEAACGNRKNEVQYMKEWGKKS